MTRNADRLALWGGIECTINRVGEAYRDQLDISGHYERTDDLERVAALGIEAIRYPLLWETFAGAADPERLWALHDERLGRLRALGVRPIVGLVHHGSGPRETSLIDPGFGEGLTAHAAKAAQRYPWVEDWTPINEPLTTARFSALYGHWYPHLRDERAFWRALANQIAASGAAMRAIREVNPDARLIQTEDLGRTSSTPERAPQAEFDNERRWATWDMLVGWFVPGHPLWDHVERQGLGELFAQVAKKPCPPQIIGINHYLTSDRFLDHRLEWHPPEAHGECSLGPVADVAAVRGDGQSAGLELAMRDCWERYGIPLALTEVHNGCTREEQMRWLAEAWDTARRLRGEDIAIEAVTAWNLLGAYDWCSLLTREDNLYESGVFDVRGGQPRATALAPLLEQLAAGERPDHPVLQTSGWWHGHKRAVPARPLLITGATGTLGQAFAGACGLRGIEHVLTDRRQIDLHDAQSIQRTLDDLEPWAVVNCAGWVRVDEAETAADLCMAVNYHGALSLAHACAERGIHYTSFSSDLVFDGELDRAYLESDAPAPLGVYGSSKALADAALRNAPGRNLIIRTASFFSPFDRHNFAIHLVDSLRAGRNFVAVGDCVTSPTYVPDLVRTTLDLIIDDEVGLWHLTNDTGLSWFDFATQIAQAAALPAILIEARNQQDMPWAAPRPRHAPLASEKAAIMPSLESAISDFARHIAG